MTETSGEYGRIAQVMRKAAIEAGVATMRWFKGDALDVETKADESPVTAADRAADEIIVDALAAALPDIAVVTEERAETQEGDAPDRFLLVDPLDGTKEFISGRGEFTVNIALIENGRPVLGVVYAPAVSRLFWTPAPDLAVEERGEPDPERVVETRMLETAAADNAALRVIASKSHRDQATDDYIKRFEVADVVSAGSSLKFCRLAAGEADLYPRFGRTMEWDTAAGHAVLSAAGGKVDRLGADGEPDTALGYGKAGYENPGFVAYSASVELR